MKKSVLASTSALAGMLLAIIAPKCPMCIVAYLSVFGVGAGTAGVITTMWQPIAVALVALGAALYLRTRHAQESLAASSCCASSQDRPESRRPAPAPPCGYGSFQL